MECDILCNQVAQQDLFILGALLSVLGPTSLAGNWTHSSERFICIFHSIITIFFCVVRMRSQEGVLLDEPEMLDIVSCLAIHLLWIKRAEVAKKLNVPRNGGMSFPTAGQSTCSAGSLSPLHACLSLNT